MGVLSVASRRAVSTWIVCATVMAVGSASLNATETSSVAATSLTVSPPVITLRHRDDSQAVVAVLGLADGSTRDVTLSAQYTAGTPGVVTIRDGLLEPTANGTVSVIVSAEGQQAELTVHVSDVDAAAPLTFRNDVLPVLTRAGCNSGRCHGAASGKDGFHLSLFGYDPDGDYRRLTRELAGRRINLDQPDDSLLLNKALGRVPHSGGARIEEGSRDHLVLLEWLSAGAVADPKEMPLPVRIEVFPKEAVFRGPGEDQLLTVVAHFSDGSDRDVTDQAVFVGNNDAAATVSVDGLVTSTGPGTAFILARYDEFTEGSGVIVRPQRPYVPAEWTSVNEIDAAVERRWKRLHLSPSPLASDEVFLRRVYIDLIGQLPSAADREAFLADPALDKRSKLVETLLQRPEFLDLWVMKWAEQLQIRTVNGISPKGLQIYDQWLRQRIRSGATVADVLSEVLPATGGTFEHPATNYYQTETTPQLLAENVAQAFLGMRIQCAQCHNHPFDRWTMTDYFGFASFFSQVGYKQAADPRELTVFNAGLGELRHPVSRQPVAPKFLGDAAPQIPAGADYRQPLADWLTSPNNRAFSRNIANLVWAHFFGIGIVEPVDDMRISNPPSNPELLDYLAARLAESKYEIVPLVREICNSRVYQLSAERTADNAWDERQFSHSRIRRLRAEVLLDCIHQVTEAEAEWPGLPAGSRAVHLADGRTQDYFLTTFGRATRDTACSCEVKTAPTLSQALHLLNGEKTTGCIAEGGLVERLLQELGDPVQVAEALYVRCYSRAPSPSERSQIAEQLQASSDPAASLADLFWALLNSNEFVFNH
jgi:hypothetical protein